MALLPYLPIVMAMAGGVLPVRCSRSTTTLSSRERENLWKEGGGKGEGKERGREGRREGGREGNVRFRYRIASPGYAVPCATLY